MMTQEDRALARARLVRWANVTAAMAMEALICAGETPKQAAKCVARTIRRYEDQLPVSWRTVLRWHRELTTAATDPDFPDPEMRAYAIEHFAEPVKKMHQHFDGPEANPWWAATRRLLPD
jgi:hypothetical protein